jgi:hypothetical protein
LCSANGTFTPKLAGAVSFANPGFNGKPVVLPVVVPSQGQGAPAGKMRVTYSGESHLPETPNAPSR